MPETTLLHEAITDNDLHVVKFLINKGVDVNETVRKGAFHRFQVPPLHHAVHWDGNIDIIEYLLDHGADVNGENAHHEKPVEHAAERGDIEILKYLKYKGATVDEKCLYNASYSGKLDMIRYLVETFNLQVNDEMLCSAVKNKHMDCVEYLLEQGADVNGYGEFDRTPLIYAIKEKPNLEMVKFLVEHGADVNKEDGLSTTPLINAAYWKSLDIVKYLVENGADVNKNKENGTTPLYNASRVLCIDIVKYLVEHGADVNKKMDNKTLLYSIMKRETYSNPNTITLRADIVKFLLENGAKCECDNEKKLKN